MKKILFTLVFTLAFFVNKSVCQPTISATVLTDFAKYEQGDIVKLYGIKTNKNDTFYYIKEQSYFYQVPNKKVKVNLNQYDFWDKIWFEYNAINIHKSGWQMPKRKQIEKKSLDYLAQLKNNNQIYEDIFLEDYLLDIVKKIHPREFYKGRKLYFTVKILNSDEDIIYTFENGTILISTQVIANLKNEKELYVKLAEAVTHIILDHNIDCINPYSEGILWQVGLIFNNNAKSDADKVAKLFMKYYTHLYPDSSIFLSDTDFIDKISTVISYTAWQEFYSEHYPESLRLIDRIIQSNLVDGEDYLLKAKLLRITGNNDDQIEEAIKCLELADSISNHNLLDIYPEKGVMLMKADRWTEAQKTFESYKEMLKGQPDPASELKWSNQMISKCRRNAGNFLPDVMDKPD